MQVFTHPACLAHDTGTGHPESAARLAAARVFVVDPETGDRLLIASKPLVPFLRDFAGDAVTLVLTGDTETDHKGGWRITASEDSERFPPPTLILKAK